MNIYDISREFFTGGLYDGDPEPVLIPLNTLGLGDQYNLSSVTACLHTSTHCDLPLHFFEDGEDAATANLICFIGKCTVVEVESLPVTGQDIGRLVPFDCERVLFKCNGKAYLHQSAASELARDGVLLVGVDSLSVGGDGFELETHRALLSAGTVILEGLELSQVPPGSYYLCAPPLKMRGAEGSPCRAILLDNSRD